MRRCRKGRLRTPLLDRRGGAKRRGGGQEGWREAPGWWTLGTFPSWTGGVARSAGVVDLAHIPLLDRRGGAKRRGGGQRRLDRPAFAALRTLRTLPSWTGGVARSAGVVDRRGGAKRRGGGPAPPGPPRLRCAQAPLLDERGGPKPVLMKRPCAAASRVTCPAGSPAASPTRRAPRRCAASPGRRRSPADGRAHRCAGTGRRP